MKFAGHIYKATKSYKSIRHEWAIIGPLGGVSFSACDHADNGNVSCGLEFHHTFEGMKAVNGYVDRAPSHKDCWLIGGQCWHDGTSLYAEESVWPMMKLALESGDHVSAWLVIEGEYKRHFERDAAEGSK